MGDIPLTVDLSAMDQSEIECGKSALSHFALDKNYRNLNHGSFGTYPIPVKRVLAAYSDEAEARPDEFIRYTFPSRLDVSRKVIAEYINAPVDTCVFVPNASTGINTVLRNLVYQPDDYIIFFDTIYGSCHKTIEYLEETTSVRSHKITLPYPLSDDALCAAFARTITDLRSAGRNPRLALFDTVTSLPGIRVPFERLTALCRRHDVLSCIDGAHGVGQIPLDLTGLDPDFFVSNCHKWLFVPRGCAVLYVPFRNQKLMRSTLPTGHGFVPVKDTGILNPLPPSDKSEFVVNFEFVGSLDSTPYLCVPAALQWRSRLTFEGVKGEEAVLRYSGWLAREAGEIVSRALGTEVLENAERSLGRCNFSNVRLPLSYAEIAQGDFATAVKVAVWFSETLKEYGTFMALLVYDRAWWVRLSATVYLTTEDFEWAGGVLRKVCDRVERGEWKGA